MSCQKDKKEALVADRQQEIIRVCETLYERMEYEEINIKEIAKSTSFCRSNIYNYYETKEEIFLDILKKEYLLWMEDMEAEMAADGRRGRRSYCRILTETVCRYPVLLKLASVHYSTIEKNCSLEKLTEFKRAMLPFHQRMQDGLGRYFPGASEKKKERFAFLMMSLAQGIYSMTHLSAKQLEAMRMAEPGYDCPGFETLFFEALYTLSSSLEEGEESR